MSEPVIVSWLTTAEAEQLIEDGRARRPDSIWYYSQIPAVFDGTADHTWQDYVTAQPAEDRHYIEALRKVIVSKKFRAGFYWMDWGARWVPLFEDGTVLDYSSGNWCELQAAIWSEEEGVQYSFNDWDAATGSEEPVRDSSGRVVLVHKHYFQSPGETP